MGDEVGQVVTFGHGTLGEDELRRLLRAAGVRRVVDVRRFPASRRHPHVDRAALERWLPEAGIAYRWCEPLGGRRTPLPDSPNTGLRNRAFHGYADHMATSAFHAAVDELVAEARTPGAAVAELPGRAGTSGLLIMCSESLWWRCHRRLLADHLTLVRGCAVDHLGHDGRRTPHPLTDTVQRRGHDVRYALDPTPELP